MARRFSVGVALLLAGCGVKAKGGGDEGGGVPTRVQEAFDARCATPGCHGDSPAQGLSLEAADSPGIVGRQAAQAPIPLVDIGNVDNSYMAQKLLPESTIRTGDRMPLGGDYENEALATDVAIIIGWIAGAELPGGGGETTTSGAEMMMCSVDAVAPGADPMIDAGDAAGQIPTEIGRIIGDNCGCHVVNDTQVTEATPSGRDDPFLRTLDRIAQPRTAEHTITVYEDSRTRVGNRSMPWPTDCLSIEQGDLEVFQCWLEAGAADSPPDALEWPSACMDCGLEDCAGTGTGTGTGTGSGTDTGTGTATDTGTGTGTSG